MKIDDTEVGRAKGLILEIVGRGRNITPDQYRDLLQRLSPFLIREDLEGADSKSQSDHLISLLWAAVGDARAKLGDPQRAATAYAFSTKFHALTAVFDNYARIVLEHDLTEHFAMAITSLVEGEKNNRATSIVQRFLMHLIWIMRSPWGYIMGWKERFLRVSRRRQLEARLREPGDGQETACLRARPDED